MHSYEEYNEPIQKLIKIMKDDYPNGFELCINKIGADLKNNQTVQCYLGEDFIKEECGDGGLSMEDIQKEMRSMGY